MGGGWEGVGGGLGTHKGKMQGENPVGTAEYCIYVQGCAFGRIIGGTKAPSYEI